jgi:hypothetical protein
MLQYNIRKRMLENIVAWKGRVTVSDSAAGDRFLTAIVYEIQRTGAY